MENEAHRRAQVLSSHNVEEFRAFLKEKANEPAPQPASYRMGGIVRAVFPQLCLLRKRGYSLNMLVGPFEENGLRITATALSGYMKKLNEEAEVVSAIEVCKGRTQPSPGAQCRKAAETKQPREKSGMNETTPSTPDSSTANEPAAGQENPAVARCMSAWTSAYKANHKNDYEASKAADLAYRNAMPRLCGYENICNFTACVAHGILIDVIRAKDSTKLLYAAQVALSSVHRPAPPKSAAA